VVSARPRVKAIVAQAGVDTGFDARPQFWHAEA